MNRVTILVATDCDLICVTTVDDDRVLITLVGDTSRPSSISKNLEKSDWEMVYEDGYPWRKNTFCLRALGHLLCILRRQGWQIDDGPHELADWWMDGTNNFKLNSLSDWLNAFLLRDS